MRRFLTHPLALGLAALLSGAGLGCSSATATDGGPVRSVLFIGNSFTSVNDLPAVVAGVARAAHDSLRTGMTAGPNLAVIDHVNGATDALATIDGGRWNFVVLQQGATPPGVCRDTLVIAAMRLAPHARASGARLVLFAPWERRQPVTSVQAAAESARLAARAVGGVVAPVGGAWREALRADPSAPVYGSDGLHPAPAGTLLSALTLYDRLLGYDVRRLPLASLGTLAGGSLTQAQLRMLAFAAHTASEALPADPSAPAPPDTTIVSPGGGPC